ncbi:MAG TPA: hypothetical protein VFG35_22200, partial [Actinoplanes sp.]|nr:hypothetical protein [Actinoplanes sp.]
MTGVGTVRVSKPGRPPSVELEPADPTGVMVEVGDEDGEVTTMPGSVTDRLGAVVGAEVSTAGPEVGDPFGVEGGGTLPPTLGSLAPVVGVFVGPLVVGVLVGPSAVGVPTGVDPLVAGVVVG